jgi:hypothetical protein
MGPTVKARLKRTSSTRLRGSSPTFSFAEDPMEADDWLRVIETKLDLTNCIDEECIILTVHQLEGTAKSWWDSYCDSHQDPAHITWEELPGLPLDRDVEFVIELVPGTAPIAK